MEKTLVTHHSIFLNHVNVFNSWNGFFGWIKVFESQRRPGSFLDKSVILLDYVIEIFDLSYLNLFLFYDNSTYNRTTVQPYNEIGKILIMNQYLF